MAKPTKPNIVMLNPESAGISLSVNCDKIGFDDAETLMAYLLVSLNDRQSVYTYELKRTKKGRK